jgi:hypothetical protein
MEFGGTHAAASAEAAAEIVSEMTRGDDLVLTSWGGTLRLGADTTLRSG